MIYDSKEFYMLLFADVKLDPLGESVHLRQLTYCNTSTQDVVLMMFICNEHMKQLEFLKPKIDVSAFQDGQTSFLCRSKYFNRFLVSIKE